MSSALAKAAKGLLLKRLSHDWIDEFERIIGRVATRWEIKQLGF
jgi:hypothetical protein